MVAALSPIADHLSRQRCFFASGVTRDVQFRLAALRRLRQGIVENQAAILAAVQADLGRPAFEGYFEIGAILELDHILRHLPQWIKPQRVPVPLNQQPGSAWIQPEPVGVVLILGPWNYPLQLMLSPLFGAIAAGNCALLKPSELAPATSQVLAQLIAQVFDPGHVTVVEGGGGESRYSGSQTQTDQRKLRVRCYIFSLIFFPISR